MEKVKAYIRNVKCSICNTKLLSVYARNSITFFSVSGWYYCEKCQKIFKLEDSNKIVTTKTK